MAYTATRHAFLGTGTMVSISVPLTLRRLKAASIASRTDGSPNTQAACQISLTSQSGGDTVVLAVLAAGWVSFSQPLGWTGDIPIDEDTQITYSAQIDGTLHTILGAVTDK